MMPTGAKVTRELRASRRRRSGIPAVRESAELPAGQRRVERSFLTDGQPIEELPAPAKARSANSQSEAHLRGDPPAPRARLPDVERVLCTMGRRASGRHKPGVRHVVT